MLAGLERDSLAALQVYNDVKFLPDVTPEYAVTGGYSGPEVRLGDQCPFLDNFRFADNPSRSLAHASLKAMRLPGLSPGAASVDAPRDEMC